MGGADRRLRCTCILGNHDAFLLQPELVHGYNEAPIIAEAVAWCRERLVSDEVWAGGHTHIQMTYVESIPGRVSVVLHRVELDPVALYAVADASDNPLAPMLKANYV